MFSLILIYSGLYSRLWLYTGCCVGLVPRAGLPALQQLPRCALYERIISLSHVSSFTQKPGLPRAFVRYPKIPQTRSTGSRGVGSFLIDMGENDQG